MNDPKNIPVFGSMSMISGDVPMSGVAFDRISLDPAGRVMFLSILADGQHVKGVGAHLGLEKRVVIRLQGDGLSMLNRNGIWKNPNGDYGKMECGYTRLIYKLPHNMAHAIFYSRDPGVLLASSDDHLWQAITRPEFTTPLLREWMPWIRAQLVAENMLIPGFNHRCDCSYLMARTPDIDKIVSRGLSMGHITIPRKPTAKERVA